MVLSKKVMAFLLIVFLLQPLVLLGILKIDKDSTSSLVNQILQIQKNDEMYQSARVLKDGSDVILKEYKVNNSDELFQLADSMKLKTISLTKEFANQSIFRLHTLMTLIGFEFLLCMAGITCLLIIFGKSRKDKSVPTEFPNALA